MSKFIKIIIDKKNKEFKNIEYIPEVIVLYEKFSKYLYDDYFTKNSKNIVDSVIELIERTTPFFWVVIDKETERFAGFGFLENLTGCHKKLHSAEATTCFNPEFWGKYTKICAKKFVNYCFKKYRFKKLKAYVFPQNNKVTTFLKKVGFKKEARLEAETLKNGEFQDIDVYSIINTIEKRGENNGL